MKSASFYLLLITALTEGFYIIFRNPVINKYNIYFLSAAAALSVASFVINPAPGQLLPVCSIMAAVLSKALLKNKPFEKPDYRYLLILLGAIFIH